MDLSKCSCDKAGFCPVFRRDMDSKNHHWCKTTVEEKRIRYYEENVGKYKNNQLQKTEEKFYLPKQYSVPKNIEQVEIITFHFNPTGSKKLKETYYDFLSGLKNLAKYVKCYELVFDDNEPEIKNSKVIKGTLEKNCMWQKESLMNVAIKESNVNDKKYVIWVDHDIIFDNPNWLIETISKLESGVDFIQPFVRVKYLSQDKLDIQSSSVSRVYVKKTNDTRNSRNSSGAPGAVWAAKVESLSKISPLPNSFLGSGDEFLAFGLFKGDDWERHHKLYNYEKKIKDAVEKHILKTRSFNFNVDYTENNIFHLWHGDFTNRQYTTRYHIAKDNNIDLTKDIIVNDNGILEFVGSRAEHFSKLIYEFFENRKEDG